MATRTRKTGFLARLAGFYTRRSTCSKTTTQLRRATKCVCNVVFRFVYRSVEHAVLEVSVRFSKVAANIYLDL